jgi:FMNH2-dependent dimethyl sulfone monooxygenase
MSDFRIGLFYPSSTAAHAMSPLPKERNPDVTLASTHVAVIRAAEAAGLDYAFLADAWSGVGPVHGSMGVSDPRVLAPILAGVLFGASEHIKIITTMHQSWLHPLHIARIGASLDALSEGRWGMNAVSGSGFAPDLVKSVTSITDHDALYAAAGESMDIALQAWENEGEVDFQGEYFQVKGRLIGPSPVQRPHPVIVSAGASPSGCEFAGRYASLAFIPGRASAEVIADRRAQIQAAAERAGRGDVDIKVLLHASIILGDTQQEADAISSELRDSIDLRAVHEWLQGVAGTSMTYDELFSKYTESELRDLGDTGGTVRMHGDADYIADAIQKLQADTGCDGLSLSFPYWQPENIERFGETVTPLLEERNVWTSAPSRGWPW